MRDDFFVELSDDEVSMVGAEGTGYSCTAKCSGPRVSVI